ncbi:hypothetical protein [Microbacterium xylanilyticum]
MSEGPIRLWRQAWVAPVVSIPDSERVCYPWPPTGTVACGRRKTPRDENLRHVTCPECLAALRADGIRTPAHPLARTGAAA